MTRAPRIDPPARLRHIKIVDPHELNLSDEANTITSSVARKKPHARTQGNKLPRHIAVSENSA